MGYFGIRNAATGEYVATSVPQTAQQVIDALEIIKQHKTAENIKWINIQVVSNTQAIADVRAWAESLIYGSTVIQETYWEDLWWAVNNLGLRIDISKIKIKETLVRFAAKDWNLYNRINVRTATDLLRLFAYIKEQDISLAEKVQRCFKSVHGKCYKQKVEASVRVSLNDYSYSHRDVLYGIGYNLACQETEKKYNTKITLTYGEVAKFIETLALLKEDSLNWKIMIDLCTSDFDELSEKESEDASEVNYEGSVEKVVPIPKSVLDNLSKMKYLISSMLKTRQDINKIANDLKQEDQLIKKASAMITQRAIQNNTQLQADVAAVMADFGSYSMLLNGSSD